MSTFDERRSGQEAKYAMDEATKFKTTARRNKLLGLWAAELMGLSGDEAGAYAKQVVLADLEEPGDGDVIRKVKGDFEAAKVDRSEADIQHQLTKLMDVAHTQIEAESAAS